MESIHFRRGFSLVELMVVLAIIGVVMSIVLTSQSSFNKTIILKNTTYDIALTLRNAQTYGLGSRASNAIANAGYGIHFQNAPTKLFTLFADVSGGASCAGMTPDCAPGDHIYNESDTLVQTYTLGNNIAISDFCVLLSGVWSCTYAHNGYSGGLSSLDIVFARPNPDASIRANGSVYISYASACLAVTSPQGGFRYVSVAASGQITANAASCP